MCPATVVYRRKLKGRVSPTFSLLLLFFGSINPFSGINWLYNSFFIFLPIILYPHLVTSPAVNGPVAARLKGYFRDGSTPAARSTVHLTRITSAAVMIPLLLLGRPAIRTTGGFIVETLFQEKCLLPSRKHKLGPAILTN